MKKILFTFFTIIVVFSVQAQLFNDSKYISQPDQLIDIFNALNKLEKQKYRIEQIEIDETVYYGQYNKNTNKPDGIGVMIFKDGSIYSGNYKNGIKEGYGYFISADWGYYLGQFKNDVYDGRGELEWKETGSFYIGNFVNGKMEGNGKITTKDYIYEGEFKNGEFNGHGKLTQTKKGNFKFPIEGQFANGEFVSNKR